MSSRELRVCNTEEWVCLQISGLSLFGTALWMVPAPPLLSGVPWGGCGWGGLHRAWGALPSKTFPQKGHKNSVQSIHCGLGSCGFHGSESLRWASRMLPEKNGQSPLWIKKQKNKGLEPILCSLPGGRLSVGEAVCGLVGLLPAALADLSRNQENILAQMSDFSLFMGG